MISFNRELFDEINLLRSDPIGYAEKVERYKGHFVGSKLLVPGFDDSGEIFISTKEGRSAFSEAS